MKPNICVPMGDPAGVGPEISVAAAATFVSDDSLKKSCHVLIIGHTEALKTAAKVMQVTVPLHTVTEDMTSLSEDAINVFDMPETVDMQTLRMGKVQGACGKAAFTYIKKAVDLCLAGKGQALATTPINKESFKAGGVDYIGHTEVLADLTKSHDPLTMFQVHDLRVFFLTRHLSLAKACEAVKENRVLDYLQRCHKALLQLGLQNPSIAVAGLNPHCGEHGLFGNEEDTQLMPAIEKAKQLGLDVSGPYPADSVFHFALNGRWDAVLSLYHDQGHIATKMVDFHRTISLTLGMPILRTSVDHGTAFDIAGKGSVSAVSMIEAIRLAALYAPFYANND